jgi:O-antigen ligase
VSAVGTVGRARLHHRARRGLLVDATAVAVAAPLGVVAAYRPAIGVGLAVALLVAFAALARPESATLVGLVVLFSNAEVIAVRLHGFPYVAHAAVPLLLGVPFFYYVVVRRRPVLATPVLPLLVAFLGVQVLSTLLSRDPVAAVGGVARFVGEGLLIFFLVTNVVRTRVMLRRVVWALVLTGAALGALTAYQQYLGSQQNDYLGFAQRIGIVTIGQTNGVRPSGPIFGDPNSYAEIMLMLVPLGFALFMLSQRRLVRLVASAATVLVMLGVLLTYSRGAALGFGVLFCVAVLLGYVRLRWAFVAAVAIAALVVSVPAYEQRLTSLGGVLHVTHRNSETDTSIAGRATEMLGAALVFADHPLLGVGPGLYPSYYREYAKRVPYFVQNEARKPHDRYLGVAAETGILGLTVFLGILALTIRGLIVARRAGLGRHRDLAWLAAGLLLAVVGNMTTGVFLHLAYQRYFWLLLALAGSAYLIATGKGDDPPYEA